jgi:teichoic acid transport system ATP-binding protein
MKEEMKGVTKLLVTHDMNSIANMADRVIMLDKGRIVQEGKPLEVIENYLKMMHTEVFEGKSDTLESFEINGENKKMSTIYSDNWISVDKSEIGGAGDIIITACKILINGNEGSLIKPGDDIDMYVKVMAKKKISDIIIGYIFKDKYGNSIVGENTLGSEVKVPVINQDEKCVYKISIKWPQVKEGDYFVTLGIGEGTDQMVHKIQCWAHNVIHIEAMTLIPMHGIVNNNILKVERFDID